MGLTRRGRITEKDVNSEPPTENRQLSLSLESFGIDWFPRAILINLMIKGNNNVSSRYFFHITKQERPYLFKC